MPQVGIGRPYQRKGQIGQQEQRLPGNRQPPFAPQPLPQLPPLPPYHHGRRNGNRQQPQPYRARRITQQPGAGQHPDHPRHQQQPGNPGEQNPPVRQWPQQPPGQRKSRQANQFHRQQPGQPGPTTAPAVPTERLRPGSPRLLRRPRRRRQHQRRRLPRTRHPGVNPLPQRIRRQPLHVAKHQRLRMVIANHIFIGIAQVNNNPARLPVIPARGNRRRGQARPAVRIIPQRGPGQRRVRCKTPLQPVAQFALEQLPVKRRAPRKLLRQTRYRPISPVGIENQILRPGHPLRKLPNLGPVIRPVVRGKLPNLVPAQIRYPLIPERPGVDDGRPRRRVGIQPFRRRNCGMRPAIDAGKSQRIQRGCAKHNGQDPHRRRICPPVNQPRQPGAPCPRTAAGNSSCRPGGDSTRQRRRGVPLLGKGRIAGYKIRGKGNIAIAR